MGMKIKKARESMALLKILARGVKSIEDGKIRPVREAFRDVRKKAKNLQDS